MNPSGVLTTGSDWHSENIGHDVRMMNEIQPRDIILEFEVCNYFRNTDCFWVDMNYDKEREELVALKCL